MGLFGSDKNPRAELAVLFAKEDEPMEAASIGLVP